MRSPAFSAEEIALFESLAGKVGETLLRIEEVSGALAGGVCSLERASARVRVRERLAADGLIRLGHADGR